MITFDGWNYAHTDGIINICVIEFIRNGKYLLHRLLLTLSALQILIYHPEGNATTATVVAGGFEQAPPILTLDYCGSLLTMRVPDRQFYR